MGSLSTETALRLAEDRLRADGKTGAQAFSELLSAMNAQLEGREHPYATLFQALPPSDRPLSLAYERFFSDVFKGKRGQYFTPPPLAEFLVQWVDLQPGETVLDPTCGSGGLLVTAARSGGHVRGIEIDPLLAELARVHLRWAQLSGTVDTADFFGAGPAPVDVILANPPFSVLIENSTVLKRHDRTAKVLSDHLFVEALPDWLLPGGRAVIILPWSFLHHPGAGPVRQQLQDRLAVDRIIALPEGVFRPFGGAAGRAVILVLRKGPPKTTLWSEVLQPGWDVRRKSYRPTLENDLDRVLQDLRAIPLPHGQWTPASECGVGRPLSELATLVRPRHRPSRQPDTLFESVDLADVHRDTGEVHPRPPRLGSSIIGLKTVLFNGDILFSRLRPDLGVVGILPDHPGPRCGSTEWIVVRPRTLRFFLWSALRTPALRRLLPSPSGQTRPRITPQALAALPIAWPGAPVAAAIDTRLRHLVEERERLLRELLAVHEAVAEFAAGRIDVEELARRAGTK